jgi:predicted ATPase
MKLDHYQNYLLQSNIKLNSAQEEILTVLANLNNQINDYYSKTGRLLSSVSFKKQELLKGIYLYGSFGTGKSMLVDLFFSNLEIKEKYKVHYHGFMLEIHDYLNKLKNSSKNKKNADLLKYAAQYIAKQYKVLYIDELQISDIADAMIVGKLFRELLKQKVIILITSNFAPDDLYKDGLQRESFLPFIELMQNNMQVLKMNSSHDYRKNKLK